MTLDSSSAAPRAPLRTVIAEDEPLARDHLRTLIQGCPALALVGEVADGTGAVALVEALRPDVLFLDVRMPGHDGFAVLAALTHRPHVVFTTAHDSHAVQAFELGAVDYLLKPFGALRFDTAVTRLQERVGLRADIEPLERLREVQDGTARPLERVFVRLGQRLVPIRLAEVSRLDADGDYVALVAEGRRHLLGMTLSALLPRLDAARFVRIHRSHVVNLDFMSAIRPHDAGRYLVELRDGAKIVASRSGTQLLRQLTG
ncbi:LytTR family DNA-binding domain-containing protein [Gemmatimonas sp.]|uniref:LytR/AlgR family response regulator transcription factor n=1 Tax=Gemmatimonas sp. TaxID=1962908 RepID=UPI0026168983|nr:LytTR family DNA-binding domain-containing protein [Gemmatimonas sp.]